MKALDMAPLASPSILASALTVKIAFSLMLPLKEETTILTETYEVWVSLLPDHMMTSAGEVLVRILF